MFRELKPCCLPFWNISFRNIPICCLYRILPLILLVSTISLSAQNDTTVLDEIEIYGIKPLQSIKSLNPTQVITSKQLEYIPTASVAEAVRNFSGVVIKDFGGVGGLKTVMVRSLGANHTGVFVDGISTGDAATGQIDLGKFQLQDVGTISLSIGQPEFGLQPARMYSSASILEISQKAPELLSKNFRVQASLKAGSFNTINPSVKVDSRINKSITTGISLNYNSSKGNFPYKVINGSSITNLERENSDIKSLSTLIKSRIQLSDSGAIKVNLRYYDSDRGLPGAVIFYNSHSSQRLKNKDLLAGASYENNPSKKLRMLTNFNYSSSELIYKDPDWLNNSGGLHNKYNQSEYYVSQVGTYKLMSKLSMSLAADLIFNELTTNAYQVKNPQRLTTLAAASIQYQTRQTRIQGSLLYTGVIDQDATSNKKHLNRFSPAITIMQSLTSDKSVKLSFMYKDIFRMPTFNDLYYIIVGNNILEPEKASLFNLGVTVDKSLGNTTGIMIKVDAFNNLVQDKIVTVPTRNLFIWSTTNIGKVDIKGVEANLALSKQISKLYFELSGNYTYQQAKDITSKTASNYGNQIAYIPYETASGLLNVNYNHFTLGVNTLYNGFRYTSNTNTSESILDSWTSTDLILGWSKKYSAREFGIKTELVNLFNNHYEVVRGFPMMGRAVYVNLYITL